MTDHGPSDPQLCARIRTVVERRCGTDVIRIEFEPAVHSSCECCGADTTRLTRFVHDDDAAYGVYYAAFGASHPEVKAIVSVGKWGEGSTPADRAAFAPRVEDVYHLTDHIFRDDPEIRSFFARRAES